MRKVLEAFSVNEGIGLKKATKDQLKSMEESIYDLIKNTFKIKSFEMTSMIDGSMPVIELRTSRGDEGWRLKFQASEFGESKPFVMVSWGHPTEIVKNNSMVVLHTFKFSAKTISDKFNKLVGGIGGNKNLGGTLSSIADDYIKDHSKEIDNISKCLIAINKQLVVYDDMIMRGIFKK